MDYQFIGNYKSVSRYVLEKNLPIKNVFQTNFTNW
jgi:hypothetical protein